MASKSLCTLNGVIVRFDPEAEIKVGLQEFLSSDQLSTLRSENSDTHMFRRDGEDQILSIPISCDTTPIGNTESKIRLGEVPWVASSMVLDSLIRFFIRNSRTLARPRPLVMLSSQPADMLLSRAWIGSEEKPEWLEKRVSYEFSTRIVYPDENTPQILLACEVRTRNKIDATCDVLINKGIDIAGRYVQAVANESDLRFEAYRKLVGRVAEVRNDFLILEDAQEGITKLAADSAYLEPRGENFTWIVQQLLKDKATRVLDTMAASASKINGGPDSLSRVQKAFSYISNQSLELAQSVSFELSPILREGSDNWVFSAEVATKPTLVFDPSGGRTDKWSERGVDSSGPYDRQYFTPKQPRIAIICEASVQGQVEQFVYKFVEGMPNTSGRRDGTGRKPYAKGFVRRFALEKPIVQTFLTQDSSAQSYKDACRRALESGIDSGETWNLALVQVRDAFRMLEPEAGPYYVTKAMFMKRGVSVQEVRLESMRVADHQLTYILNNISLAIYAKLGGVPWLLKADSPIAHELVIGVGSHHSKESRIGSPDRVVGITTVFTGDGRYLLESRTESISYENYHNALLESLEKAIGTVRAEQNWRDTDTIRLIFHTFQPLKNVEVEAIDELITKLALPNTEYAVVHLVDQHPFKLYDENNRGAAFPGNQRKGVLAPERGQMVKLNRSEVLVSFVGSNDVKLPHHGLPSPVLLRLHPESTFKDMTYIARQAFSFSCNSWQTFFPARLPITTLYSEMMARRLHDLEQLSDWDSDSMLNRIGRTLWYL